MLKKRILLIDDEELVLKSVARLLEREGYEVIACHTGEEALDKVRSENFHLIISDVRMPNMNGVEVIRSIRKILKQKNEKKIPEILITGYADEITNQEIESLEVADYLYKPFDLRDFLACTKKHLPNN